MEREVEPLRPLTTNEALLLAELLAHEFEGVEQLRIQSRALTARRGCDCGCGTVELVPQDDAPPRSRAQNPVPCEGVVRGDDGTPIGGVLLFVKDGLLSSLEVYETCGHPLPLPTSDQVEWMHIDRA
jgi:hypothetical protein